LPGGFVDLNETAEAALAREVIEEVGLQVTSIQCLATFLNSYRYLGTDIPVLDIFYVCRVDSFDSMGAAPEEVKQVEFLLPLEQHLDDIAFESNRYAVELFATQRANDNKTALVTEPTK